MNPTRTVIVDGAQVAYSELADGDEPKVYNLLGVCRALEAKGLRPMVIVGASLRHEIDDLEQLEALIDQQAVRQAPSGTDADYFILETAEQQNGHVVSNDRFEGYRDKYTWSDERRVPLMIVDGEVELYEGQA